MLVACDPVAAATGKQCALQGPHAANSGGKLHDAALALAGGDMVPLD